MLSRSLARSVGLSKCSICEVLDTSWSNLEDVVAISSSNFDRISRSVVKTQQTTHC